MTIDIEAALRKVDQFFMGEGPVHATLRTLSSRMSAENIDYAVIDGMALVLRGYERLTVDVDVLLTPEGLQAFHERMVGRGYLPIFDGARKHFRDTETGVQIEIITTGEYPGDGKPKEVSFPSPNESSSEINGIRVLTLEKLIELKLASGLSAPHRVRDIADVQQLIEVLNLPRDIADRLAESVRSEYLRLWEATRRAREEKIGPGQE